MGDISWKMRSLLLGLHAVCALMGLAILGTSAYLYQTIQIVKKLPPSSVANLFIAMMVLGAFTLILAFHGCCVALLEKENCCMNFDAALLCILLACQLTLIVFIKQSSNRNYLENNIRKAINRELANYQYNKKLVDFVQEDFHCCESSRFPFVTYLPTSCCPKNNGNRCSFETAYGQECTGPVVNFVSRKSNSAALTLFGAGVIELLCLFSMFRVISSIKRRNTYEP